MTAISLGDTLVTPRELATLRWWCWWAHRVGLTLREERSLAYSAARWARAASDEGINQLPMWLIWQVGLALQPDPHATQRSRSLCLGRHSSNDPWSHDLYLEMEMGLDGRFDERPSYVQDMLSEALLRSAERWLGPELISREGRCILRQITLGYRAESPHLKEGDLKERGRSASLSRTDRLIGLFLAHLLSGDLAYERGSSSRWPLVSEGDESGVIYSVDLVTLSLIERAPQIIEAVPTLNPNETVMRSLCALIEREVDLLSSRGSETSTSGTARAEATQLFCEVATHLELLESRARRLELERCSEALKRLGPLRATQQTPRHISHQPLDRLRERVEVSGELCELSRRGPLTRVIRSELLYLGEELIPGVDSFAWRWAESQLLYYRREQAERSALPRTWSWRFVNPCDLSRDHIGLSALSAAHVVSLWVQRSIAQSLTSLSSQVSSWAQRPLASWSWGELQEPRRASYVEESRRVLEVLAQRFATDYPLYDSHLSASKMYASSPTRSRPEMSLNELSQVGSSEAELEAELSVLWTVSPVSLDRAERALIIDLSEPDAPTLRVPPCLRSLIGCSATLKLSCAQDEQAPSREELPRWLTPVSEALIMILEIWATSD